MFYCNSNSFYFNDDFVSFLVTSIKLSEHNKRDDLFWYVVKAMGSSHHPFLIDQRSTAKDSARQVPLFLI